MLLNVFGAVLSHHTQLNGLKSFLWFAINNNDWKFKRHFTQKKKIQWGLLDLSLKPICSLILLRSNNEFPQFKIICNCFHINYAHILTSDDSICCCVLISCRKWVQLITNHAFKLNTSTKESLSSDFILTLKQIKCIMKSTWNIQMLQIDRKQWTWPLFLVPKYL